MQTVTVDVKAVAKERGPHLPRHPLLPPAVLAFTRYWMKLSTSRPPQWSLFHMVDVQDLAPYITVLKAEQDGAFSVEFMGSAVSSMLGEDLTGTRVTKMNGTFNDIDWFERCRRTIDRMDLNVSTGSANPQYTSRIDYVGADYPFMDDADAGVSYVVALTAAQLN